MWSPGLRDTSILFGKLEHVSMGPGVQDHRFNLIWGQAEWAFECLPAEVEEPYRL